MSTKPSTKPSLHRIDHPSANMAEYQRRSAIADEMALTRAQAAAYEKRTKKRADGDGEDTLRAVARDLKAWAEGETEAIKAKAAADDKAHADTMAKVAKVLAGSTAPDADKERGDSAKVPPLLTFATDEEAAAQARHRARVLNAPNCTVTDANGHIRVDNAALEAQVDKVVAREAKRSAYVPAPRADKAPSRADARAAAAQARYREGVLTAHKHAEADDVGRGRVDTAAADAAKSAGAGPSYKDRMMNSWQAEGDDTKARTNTPLAPANRRA